MTALKNPKHEYFAQGLAKGQTQADAYENAGYKPSEQNASRLTSNDKVQDRIAELQARAAVRAEITVSGLTTDLLRLAKSAEAFGTESGVQASRASLMDAAKLNGLIVEKTENTNKQVDNMSDADLADIARAGSARANKEKSSAKGSNPLH